MLKKYALILAAFFILPLWLCAAEVIIYHTSDAHGAYQPKKHDGKNLGGYDVLAQFLKTEKLPYLLLDCGDFTNGSAEAAQSKGGYSVELMDMVGYTAAAAGNHESDFGDDAMLQNIGKARFDLLAANLYLKKGGKRPAGVLPYKIYEVNGKKIAVIGLGQDIRAATQKVKFTKGRKELKKALKEIKKNGADAVVLLAHLPFADNEHQKPVILGNITKKLSGINLALGGHTHKVIQGAKIGDIYYVESGTELRGVSRVALKFNDETGKLENITSQYIELDADKTGRDEAVKAYAQNIAGAALETVLGQAKEDIKKLNPNPKEAVDSPLGNLFADMIRNIAKTDIAMQNTGGVRRDIPAGPVTQRLAAEVFPFPNTIVTMRVNGAFIRKTAQDSLAEQSSLFQYSGLALRYKYEDGKPVITQIKIQGRDLDDKKMYTLAINDYNAAGNSEGYMFKNLKNKTPLGSKGIAQYFTEYLQANPGGIYAAQTGRIVREY